MLTVAERYEQELAEEKALLEDVKRAAKQAGAIADNLRMVDRDLTYEADEISVELYRLARRVIDLQIETRRRIP